jgi:hypothetical protein
MRPVEFENDPAKSEKNKRKHGIDFVEAAALWLDPRALELETGIQRETPIRTNRET